MLMTSLAADPRLSLSPLSCPWISSPVVLSPPVQVFSANAKPVDGLRLPRLMAGAAISLNAKPEDRLRRHRRCSMSDNSSGTTMSTIELQPSLELKAKAAELIDTLKGTSLFLVGMNGLMKTKLGEVLADALQYCYFDSDDVVEQVAGGAEAVRDFREKDEKEFLESESEVLKQLSSMARLVVCAGDGATQGATNLSYLRYGISIWVDIPFDVMASEFSNLDEASDAFDEAVAEMARRQAKMKRGYATADASVSLLKVASKLGYADLGDVTPEDMALEVLKEIDKLTRVKKMMEDAARPF